MKEVGKYLVLVCLALTSFMALALERPDTLRIPTRSIVVTGNADAEGAPEMIGVFYNTEDSYFNDPGAPRFLFLDRNGKIAFGIGGQIYGTVQYGFDGTIDDGSKFVTYDIPIPADPARRQAVYGDASHSSIFLKMVGRTTHFGFFTAYIQTNFTGGSIGSYGLKLKQAYLSLGYVTVGLTNSVFADPNAAACVIDPQSPAGQVSSKNVLIKYNPRFRHGWSAAISVELPKTGYRTADGLCEKIAPRVPDIPAYVQYAWNDGGSHIRLTGMVRTLSYRNLVQQSNRMQTGWAVSLGGNVKLPRNFNVYYQGSWGRGYGRYLNDVSDANLDLIPSVNTASGRMTAPEMLGIVGGFRHNISSHLICSATYSYCRLYGTKHLGADSFRHSTYVAANIFYDIIPDLRTGVEYLYGQRVNYDGSRGHAHRVMALVNFTF